MRVLVIGGGIGGLAAAVALRRVGLDVTVFEQAPALRVRTLERIVAPGCADQGWPGDNSPLAPGERGGNLREA